VSLIPTDWTSFIWGIAVGGLAALFSGVIKKAGEDLYCLIKARIKAPEPVPVSHDFDPILFEHGECSWVPESKRATRATEGYTYYPHGKRGAKCFRMVHTVHGQTNEWLMVRPNAKRLPRT
jgi:hypothetical protein